MSSGYTGNVNRLYNHAVTDLQADMANRPPAITGGTQANQWQAADSMHRTLRPQGEVTRSGSPASQAAWAMPRCPK